MPNIRELHDLLPHLLSEEFLSAINLYILQGEIFAAFCLGVGIIWESDKYKGDEIKKVAFLLVMLGVVFETIFSVLLFASEEKISEIQKSKIIELERKLAPRTLEPWQRQMLVDLLSPAPKGRVIIKPNFVDMEATVFANQITQALIEAGFQGVGDAPLNVLSFGQPGIQIAFKEPGNLPPHALSGRRALQYRRILEICFVVMGTLGLPLSAANSDTITLSFCSLNASRFW
jgi:hypothetical protein